ncbi:MAG: hypothetical protein ACMXYE_02090 [Candidatus Woesearchaeota archaeon]
MRYKKKRSKEKRIKKTEDVRKKKRLTLMSAAIIVIMISSGFAIMLYGFEGPSTVEHYNGFRFTYTTEGISVKVNNNNYFFDWLPQDVDELNVDQNAINLVRNAQALTATTDIDTPFLQDLAVASFMINEVFSKDNKWVMNAYTEETGEMPTATCADATSDIPVLEFREAILAPLIRTEGNCIILEYDSASNLQRLTHNFLYQYLGIIE